MKCPKCGATTNQFLSGKTKAGSQRVLCWGCRKRYTPNPKPHIYPEVIRQIAIKEYYIGLSGRGVGKIHRISKANVFRWIKDAKKQMHCG